MQEEIVPLTGGKPFFSVIVGSRNAGPTYYHLVPPGHFRKKLPAAAVTVTLSYRNRRWEVRYRGDSGFKSFTRPTWKKFVVDNDVRVGDGLVFELINTENLELKVQILRSEDPPEGFERQSLNSSAVVID